MNRSPVGDRGDAAAEALALVGAERDDGDRDGERTGDSDVLLRALAVGSNADDDDDDMPALRADFDGLCGGEAPRSVMNMVGLVVGTEGVE